MSEVTPIQRFAKRRLLLLFAAFAIIPLMLLSQEKAAGKAEVIAELRRGDNGAALSLVQRALASAPHDCTLHTLEGLARNGVGQSQLALHSFGSALKYCPAYLPALEGSAQIEYAQNSAKTVPLLQRILSIKPDNTTAQAMLATRLRAQGDA